MCIAENIAKVRQQIQTAATNCGRNPAEVQLLAVSKTKPLEAIRQAYAAGQRHFGENYVQEGVDKIQASQDLADCHWHFIGPLQSNKTRVVAEHFDWVHSIERIKIAERLSAQRPAHLPPLQVCLQVNISGESSKAGVSLAALPELANAVLNLPGLQLRGLMCIPAPCQDSQLQRQPFLQLAHALQQLQQAHPAAGLDTLSMGMSEDLDAAISAGATWVRIGTAIFGARAYPNP
ncbi:YggS family pyridoxal phosphate-dependent enzyme [Balneatrix alpica]|uniref:YggS family pyridoxal phosphate-dependent enzyme n=1 Tax=Balneatrix alpica TaxID=75684 RepID=UPI002739653E|nr:YggS family pyridoxal phosphate-dependent enzyme [Balneatrix alpica]